MAVARLAPILYNGKDRLVIHDGVIIRHDGAVPGMAEGEQSHEDTTH